jgi:hypothetical protein
MKNATNLFWVCLIVAGGLFVLYSLPSASTFEKSQSKSNEAEAKSVYDSTKKTPQGEPAYITVQHCLISFRGKLPGKPIRRTKEDAEALAKELLEKANAGENFDQIVSKYTDDSAPGIYRMANDGFPSDLNPKQNETIYQRRAMVPAFGNVGFKLEKGAYGLSEFDPLTSKYGWHIIKRID